MVYLQLNRYRRVAPSISSPGIRARAFFQMEIVSIVAELEQLAKHLTPP